MFKKLLVLLLIIPAMAAFAAGVRDITSTDAKMYLEKNRKAFLLDVRSPEERRQGYIAGSILIPIDRVGQRLAEIPRNRPVIVYCAVGSRSRVVAQALARQGYPDVINMRDGIVGWYRNGYPVQR